MPRNDRCRSASVAAASRLPDCPPSLPEYSCVPRNLLVMVCVFCVFSTCCAQDSLPLWQLERGQRFEVQSTTQRVSEIQVADDRQLSDVTDRVKLQYTVFGHDRRGGAQVQIRINGLNRTTSRNGEESTETLEPQTAFNVPGVAVVARNQGENVQVLGGESLFRTRNPHSHRVLIQMATAEIVRSWVDYPFRIPVKTDRPPFRVPQQRQAIQSPEPESEDLPEEEVLEAGTDWSRIIAIALGPAGQLQGECRYEVESVKDDTATLTMTGALHFVASESQGSDALRFRQLQFSSVDVSGTGQLKMNRDTGLPNLIEMKQQVTLQAESTVESTGKSRPMTFKQTLTQTWIASEFTGQDTR